MALNKLAYLVLPYPRSPNLLCQVPYNITSRGHLSIYKVVNSINKNLLLLNYKALVPEGVSFLFCLSKASNASRNSYTRAFVLLSCIGIICELSSLNRCNCGVNSSRFEVFIAHFVLVVKSVLACFGGGRALVGKSVTRAVPVSPEFWSFFFFFFKKKEFLEN